MKNALKKVVSVNSNAVTIKNTDEGINMKNLINNMMGSKSVESFEKNAIELDFVKVEATTVEDCFFCGVCYNSSPPSVLDKNKPSTMMTSRESSWNFLLECQGH